MSRDKSVTKMDTMPIGRLVMSMSWPAMLSMVIQACYNVVDTYFVSMIGEKSLTAITLIFPIQMLMIAVSVGTGIGINSLIARRLGARRYADADRAASQGLKLSYINWLIFVVVGVFFARPFVAAFTEDADIIAQGAKYLLIVCVGCLFVMIQVSCEKILQATGNMVLPMLTNMIGAVTNIILDPVLIFGIGPFPRMGIAGAATATVIGQALAMTVVLYILMKKQRVLHIDRKVKFDRETLQDIYVVGGPSIIMQAIACILNIGMNAILAGFSETAIAVLGVYGRLQSFIFMPVFGINQGATPIMGYNYGARNRKRLMQSYWFSMMIALIVMGAGLLLFQLLPGVLLSFFSASARMLQMGIPAFKAISWCFLPAAFGIISGGLFGATGHGFISLFGSLIRQMFGILPLAYIFSRMGSLEMVWWAYPLAEILGTIYFIITVRHLYRTDILGLDNAPAAE
jgi:putative MATE family efflux protein